MTNSKNSRLWVSFTLLPFALFLAHVSHASAQQITGRFYPEKREYVAGEPIIVVFEVINSSVDTVRIGESGCPWLNARQFEVDNAAPKKKFSLFGCEGGSGGSCFATIREIPSGGIYQQRLLLEGNFDLTSPGSYHIRAKRQQGITRKGINELGIDLTVDSEFDLVLRAPTEDELKKAYQPLLDDLHSRDFAVRSLAARAVTQNPPPFVETAILALVNDSVNKYASVDGLKRLATPAARAELLQLSSTTSPESLRQQAIPALGEIGNAEDCQAMLNIAAEDKNYTQIEAYVAAGRICKEQAVGVLYNLIATADPPLLGGLAMALKNTSSRSAVPLLISLLRSPEQNVRREAADALGILTHRKSKYGVYELDRATQSYSEWSTWWSKNGNSAPLYNPNQCVSPQPLP